MFVILLLFSRKIRTTIPQTAVSLFFDMGGAAPPTKIQQVKRFEIGDDVEGPDDEKASSLVAKYCEKMTLPLPKSTDTVHKEECVFSFDNAFTKD